MALASGATAVAMLSAHTAQAPAPPPTLLVGARIIDGTGQAQISNGWIRVDDGTIAAMGTGAPPAIAGARVVNLNGRTIVPGLSDMHVHLGPPAQARWFLKLLLAYGITNVRELGNNLDDLRAIRDWMASQSAIPHVAFSGVTIDGSFEDLRFLDSSDALRTLLDHNRRFGVQWLKVHNWVSSRALAEVAAYGSRHGLPVAGHVPLGLTSIAAIDAGLTTLEHVRLRPSEVLDDPEIVARYALDLGVNERDLFWGDLERDGKALNATLDAWAKRMDRFYLDPTLAVREIKAQSDDLDYVRPPAIKYVSAATLQQWNRRSDPATGLPRRVFSDRDFPLAKRASIGQATFSAMAHARGVRILTGTDTGVDWLIPGHALHEELQLLHRAGIPPLEVVRASTGRAAEALRMPDRGALAPGKAADLVIVNGNPLANFADLRRVESVMLGGVLHAHADLLAEAARLAGEHQPPRPSP